MSNNCTTTNNNWQQGNTCVPVVCTVPTGMTTEQQTVMLGVVPTKLTRDNSLEQQFEITKYPDLWQVNSFLEQRNNLIV